MNNNNQPFYLKTWVIVLAFLFFWPLGIGLVFLRMNASKKDAFLGSTNKNKYVIGGVVLGIIGIACISDDKAGMGVFMIIGGIFLIIYANKLAKRSERNHKYVDLIVNKGMTSIDQIAGVCNVKYDVCLKELNGLIKIGVFKNAVIDENYRSITLNANPEPTATESLASAFSNAFNGTDAAPAPVENVKVRCSGCGAQVMIARGRSMECDYCGSPITTN